MQSRETAWWGSTRTPNPCFFQELPEHRRRRLVERPSTRQAQHRPARGPCIRDLRGVAARRRTGGGKFLLAEGRRQRAVFGSFRAPRLALVRSVVMIGQVADQGGDRLLDMNELCGRKRAARGIGGRKLQPLQRDLVVIRGERAFLEQSLGLIEHLVRIAGEHPLIEAFGRRKRGPVAKHHVKEFQPVHVSAEHHQAQGERG